MSTSMTLSSLKDVPMENSQSSKESEIVTCQMEHDWSKNSENMLDFQIQEHINSENNGTENCKSCIGQQTEKNQCSILQTSNRIKNLTVTASKWHSAPSKIFPQKIQRVQKKVGLSHIRWNMPAMKTPENMLDSQIEKHIDCENNLKQNCESHSLVK